MSNSTQDITPGQTTADPQGRDPDPERRQEDPHANPETAHNTADKQIRGEKAAPVADQMDIEIPEPSRNPINVGGASADDEPMPQSDKPLTPTSISEMSLEEKKQLVSKYDHAALLSVGVFVDAEDTTSNSLLGKIVAIDHKMRTATINFDGWSVKWNSTQRFNKLAPFRSTASGYSGQKKVAIRNSYSFKLSELERHRQKVNQLLAMDFEGLSAFETLQYLSGELFVYVDSVLVDDTYTENSPFEQIESFFKTIMRFVVAWMVKVTKLAKTIEAMDAVPNLFLVDPLAAIVQAGPEMMETLAKLLGNCMRGLHWFRFYDVNQIAPEQISKEVKNTHVAVLNNSFGVVVQDQTDVDFEIQRLTDQAKYSEQITHYFTNRRDVQFGSIFNWTQYFADLGGFDAFLTLFEMGIGDDKAAKCPFQLVRFMLKPFKALNQTLTSEFATTLAERLSQALVIRFKTLSELDVKRCDLDLVEKVLEQLNLFLSVAMDKPERCKIIETTELLLGLRLLKSTNFEKRIRGIGYIRSMIERVVKTEKLKNFKSRTNNDLEGVQIQVTGFLTADFMSKWLIQNKVLDIIFGAGNHIEIVKRSQNIVNFLARYAPPLFDDSVIELVWRCQEGQHEVMVRTVYEVIEHLANLLSLDKLNKFFAMIKQETRIDEKYLKFLGQFTITAMNRQYVQMENDWHRHIEEVSGGENENEYPENFDAHLIKKESIFINAIESRTADPQLIFTGEQFGMTLFWQLCLDNSPISNETRDVALQQLLEMFIQGFRKINRFNYLTIALSQLFQHQSVYQAIKVIKGVIKSYNYDQNHRMSNNDDEPMLIFELHEKIKYLDKVVETLHQYHDLVKQRLKAQPTSEDMSALKFIGHQTHERTVKTFLNQIKYLLQDQHTCIGEKNLSLLWQIFVESPNFSREQDMFLTWINRSKADHANPNKQYFEILTPQEKKFLFLQILCQSAGKPEASLGLVKCFNNYFIQINKSLGNIKNITKRFRILNLASLEGMDTLWDICINSPNPKIREICQDLLIDVQLKQEEPNPDSHAKMLDLCMQNIEKEGTIQLLSTFLDRYEGIKDVKFDTDLQRKYPGLLPYKIKVSSNIHEPKLVKQIDLAHYQSLGYMRQQIAKEFGLQQNEFIITVHWQQLKNIDPEVDDDKFIRDFPGMSSNVQISRNPSYDPRTHPKFLLSENQQYFEKIFTLLSTAPINRLDNLYNLFVKLPVNEALQQKYITLQNVKQASNDQQRAAAWNDLLHPAFIFKLLYCVKIINGLITSPEGGQEWTDGFIQMGGFDHLVKCQIELNITSIDSKLKLKVIKELVALQQTLLRSRHDLLRNVPHTSLMNRLFDQVEMIVDFSINQEAQRALSYEQLNRRIEEAKAQKQSLKLHTLQNNKDKKKDADDDDSNSEDNKLKQSLIEEFFDQAVIVKNMFSIIKSLCSVQPEVGLSVMAAHSLQGIVRKGMLASENMYLRSTIDSSFFELMFSTPIYTNEVLHGNAHHQLKILNEQISLIGTVKESENRCIEFFKHLSKVITTSGAEVVEKLQPQALGLIQFLGVTIVDREIRESNSHETDHLLQGTMILLTSLLQKYPAQKAIVGERLLGYLIHDCLFEIPHGTKDQNRMIAPKCKSSLTRQHAFNLISVLCRDCLPNLSGVLDYLAQFNRDVSWRTGKESDWKITLYNDEKSLTGYVGIKNLACICYMNSINQQLFMIPSFRNDILSIKDPNHAKDADEDNMFMQWQELFGGLLMSQKMYINPKAFCHSFKDFDGNPTNVIEQMDVDEYLNCLLDRLENSIKKTPQANTIHHHFGGWMTNEIICTTCPHKYDRKENFLSVSISVKNKKSIKEGLDAFVEGDQLNDDNQYFCEKCDKKVDALKRQCIKRLPRYLITTLKRFEFDFDTMQRSKVDDYCEFPEQLDMSNYTQEWLHKKEAQKEGHFAMDYPSDYYNYELIGIVVHSGTATSGHYYSYIKEQEIRGEGRAQSEQWIEFNDAFVKEFDKNDIPSECYGGDVQSGWQQQRFQKSHSAYVVVYKRKMEDDPIFKDEEMAEPARGPDERLGQKQFQPPADSAIAQRIEKQNHKYWQNRFLFSSEYTDFVYQMVVNWNTNFSIVNSSLERYNNANLYEQQNTLQTGAQLSKVIVPSAADTKLALSELYSVEEISATEFKVFKFAANHYINVMQRDQSKEKVPHMVKYLKAHMNFSTQCATWFLTQFLNPKILKECLMENSEKFMRCILVGLLYTAMLKIYPEEREAMCNYWTDVQAQLDQPRQTVLGTLGILLLQQLPLLKSFSKNHKQILMLIARFTSLGAEARRFMNLSNGMERLLNYFHNECSPFYDAFLNAEPHRLALTDSPEIGLPTPESINDKKGRLAKLKLQLRQKRLIDDQPKFSYLVEALGNLARAKSSKGQQTPYQLEKSDIALTEQDNVLFLPIADFIDSIILEATKPRILNTICKAYMHFAVNDDTVAEKIFQTVTFGLQNNMKGSDLSHSEAHEHHRIRPHFMLFQYLIEAKGQSKWIETNFDAIMNQFFRKLLFENRNYFQFMEYAIEYVWKLYTRVKAFRSWMQNNTLVWSYLEDWANRYKEPPVEQMMGGGVQQQSSLKLNKSRRGRLNCQRYNKIHNLMLHQWRLNILALMKQKVELDLSSEPDLDAVDMQDFQFCTGMQIDYVQDRLVPTQLIQGVVKDDLDEIVKVSVASQNEGVDQIIWVPAYKGIIYPQGLISGLYRQQELAKIQTQIKAKQAEIEAQQRLRMQQMQKSQASATQKQPMYQGNYQHVPDDDSEDEEEDADDEFVLGHSANNNGAANGATADFYHSSAGEGQHAAQRNLSEENNAGNGSVDNNYAMDDVDSQEDLGEFSN